MKQRMNRCQIASELVEIAALAGGNMSTLRKELLAGIACLPRKWQSRYETLREKANVVDAARQTLAEYEKQTGRKASRLIIAKLFEELDLEPARRRLWLENEAGDIWVPDYENGKDTAPDGFIYWHSRFPCELNHQIYRFVLQDEVDACDHPEENVHATGGWVDGIEGRKCDACGGSQTRNTGEPWPDKWEATGQRELMNMGSTYSEDLALALVNKGLTLSEAIVVAATCCEACMNVLAHECGLDWGYEHGSKEWHDCGTSCHFCEGTDNQSPGFKNRSVPTVEKTAAAVMTEEDYLAKHGYGMASLGEFAMHKTRHDMPRRRRKEQMRLQRERDAKWQRKRDELRTEYRDKVKSGEIRPPTRVERLLEIAKGYPDRNDVQAARRILRKQGFWDDRMEQEFDARFASGKRKGTTMDRHKVAAELTDMARSLVSALSSGYEDEMALLEQFGVPRVTRKEYEAELRNDFRERFEGVTAAVERALKGGIFLKTATALKSVLRDLKQDVAEFKDTEVYSPKATFAMNHLRSVVAGIEPLYQTSNFNAGKLMSLVQDFDLRGLLRDNEDEDDEWFVMSADGLFRVAQDFHVALTRKGVRDAERELKKVQSAVSDLARLPVSDVMRATAEEVVEEAEKRVRALRDALEQRKRLEASLQQFRDLLAEATA